MKHLIPCPECNRHVRVSELACPFCASPLDLADTPPPQLPRSRLSRAATLAFGATFVSATALSACGGDAEENGMSNNAGAGGVAGAAGLASAGANVGGAVPLYGAPAGGEFGVAGFQNGADGGMGAVYGAPAEAGTGGTTALPGAAGASGEAGAGAAPDASGGKGGGPFTIYGAPP